MGKLVTADPGSRLWRLLKIKMSQLTSASAQKLPRENYLVWLPGWIPCTAILLVYVSGRNPSTNHGPSIQVLQEPISDRFRLLCPRVFFPDATMLENKKTLEDEVAHLLSHVQGTKRSGPWKPRPGWPCASAVYLHDPFIKQLPLYTSEVGADRLLSEVTNFLILAVYYIRKSYRLHFHKKRQNKTCQQGAHTTLRGKANVRFHIARVAPALDSCFPLMKNHKCGIAVRLLCADEPQWERNSC